MALDADGNLYVADTGNHRVRKIDTAGIITTVAGTGDNGYAGDGGLAADASLSAPSDLLLAPTGVLYIADSGNNRVRAIAPDGVITTYAGNGSQSSSGDGGYAVLGGLKSPGGVALDRVGQIYIADTQGSRVRVARRIKGMQYDEAGRLIAEHGRAMDYNGLDQLVAVRSKSVWAGDYDQLIEYGYGYDGLRTFARDTQGRETRWFTSNLVERDGNIAGQTKRQHYVKLGDRMIARVEQKPGDPTPVGGRLSVPGRGVEPGPLMTVLAIFMLALAGLCARLVKKLPRARALRWVSTGFIAALLATGSACLFDTSLRDSHLADALWRRGEVVYFHQGISAGPTMMSRDDGTLFEERRFSPFGMPIDAYREKTLDPVAGLLWSVGDVDFSAEPNSILNKEHDPDTLFSYHGARWMMPQTARWLTPDPPVKAPDGKFLLEPWASNPFVYILQNPIVFWDPDGFRDAGIAPGGELTAVAEQPPSRFQGTQAGYTDQLSLQPPAIADFEALASVLADPAPPSPAILAATDLAFLSVACPTCGFVVASGLFMENDQQANLAGMLLGATTLRNVPAMRPAGPASPASSFVKGSVERPVTIVPKTAAGPMAGRRLGHTFTKHGSGNTEQLLRQAQGSGRPVGQWLDDAAAEQFIADRLGQLKQGAKTFDLPAGMGRVIRPDGSPVPATRVRLVPSGSGVKTAYPME